jgi:hypothetical protein
LIQSDSDRQTFKEGETEAQKERDFPFPTPSQVQWLTTRLRFWHSSPTWKIVESLGSLYSDSLSWRSQKATLEAQLYAWNNGTTDIEKMRAWTREGREKLVKLTISLTSSLLNVPGATCITQCKLRFGNIQLELVKCTDSKPAINATDSEISNTITDLLIQTHNMLGFKGCISCIV